MDGVGREVECKLELAPGTTVVDVPGWHAERRGTVQIRTIYWDTCDHRLARAGHALRHRTTDGGSPHWTLKTTRVQRANLAVRDEHDEPGTLGRKPPKLLGALRAVIGDAALERVATIDVRRTITMLSSGTAVVEMAEDHVESRRGRRAGPCFDEIELELVHGDPTDLARAHDALVALGANPSEWSSKLRRVLDESPPGSMLPDPIDIRQLTAGAFERATVRLLQHDPALRLAPDDEAVHQARVATRRLRCDVRTLRPFLDASAAGHLDIELAWLGGALGAVRDLDVLAVGVVDRRSSLERGSIGWDELLDAIRADRVPHIAVVQEILDGPRYLALIERLRAMTLNPPLNNTVDPTLEARAAATIITARAARRLERGVRRLPRHPGDDDLHEVRKRAKQARYAFELVAGVGGRRIARRLAPIEALQDVLGTLQDTVVARAWFDEHAVAMSPAAAYLAGRLRAANEHDARALRAAFAPAWTSVRRA